MKHSHKKSFDWYSMQQRYSIRKYYFGAVSVLLGTALVLGAASSVQTVQAEENKQETTNSISVGRGEAATKPAEVSASNKEKTYAAPTVANPVETTPVKTGEVTKPAEKVEEAKDKKEEVTHQDAIDKSKLLTALSRAKKLESKLYTEASAANLQTSIQAGQSLLGKADASEAELSAAESSIQSSIIGLELRSKSNKGTVSETPVAKKANIVEAKEETNPAATTDRSAVDSAVLPTSTAAKVETTSAPASINEILKPGLSLSDARQNPAIRKEDLDKGHSGFRASSNPANPIVSGSGNTVAFSDISQAGRSYSFRGYGNSRGGNSIHYDVTTVRQGNKLNFTIEYSGPGEFVNNNFILDKGDGFGNPSNATITTPRLREQSKPVSQGGNFVSHSGYSMTSATSTSERQTIRFSLPINNPNGDLSVRLKPVTFNVNQGGGSAATGNDPYSNSNYYFREKPLLLDANPYGGTHSKPITEDIDFQTVYLPTSKLAEGETRLVREGEKGQRQITYKVHRFGNETVLGLPISNRVTKEAKPRIMQIGVAKELIDTVKPRVDQNKVGDTNNLTFYLDNDGNGVYTEGVDELVQKIAIKDGAKGEKGDQGERGLTGAQGAKGEKGDRGERGLTGAQGAKGEKGDRGERGLTGAQGAKGEKGDRGERGLTGAQGAKGEKGDRGEHGLTGAQGAKGEKGAQGERGLTGAQGAKGEKGDQGERGLTGAQGAKGEKGDKGEQGPKGEDGKTPTVKVTDGQDGTHTITINDGKGGITTTVVRDGFDGASPLVSTHRNEADKTTTVIFYYDLNDNNQFDEGDTKLKEVVIADGKQGPKGDKGDNGKDGFTPEVTVTDNNNGTHTITITQPDNRPSLTTIVKNGEDGKTPKVKAERDDAKKQTTLTFYIDKDGDGSYTAGKDELVQTTVVKDGQDGAAGASGRDGKEVLNGKVDPTTEGKDGDTFVNTQTGDVFVKKGNTWEPAGNIKGPKGDKGADGAKGEKGAQGERGLTGAQGVKGEKGDQGERGLTGSKGEKGDQGERGLTGAQGDKGEQGLQGRDGAQGPKGADGQRGPAGPQGPKGEQGNPGTPGKDGKSLIAVKNGTETKVYVEDPARPGQPLNPNQPLATITDGRNGTNGQSPTITATRSVQNGKNGVLVTITPVEGRPQTTFVEDGQKGADGKTPTVTITEGQNGTHTLTVHNPGSPDVTTTIRDGATGQAGRDGKDVLNGKVNPQPNQGKNGDKYINIETGDVYVKNNGNWDKEGNIKGPKGDKGADGAKGEKGDQGERGLTGAQGAKGADGAVGRDGRDGKDVLNGKANPEAHQGKDGDKYVNTETGDVFVKNNGNWDKEGNIKGPKGDKGADGAKGEKGDRGERGLTGAQGAKGADGAAGRDGRDGRDGKDVLNGKVNPEANQGKDGDKYVNTETGDVFVKNNGNWDKEGNIKGSKGDKGERGEDGKTPEVTVTPGKDGHSTDITFTVPGKDPVTVNVKDGENGLNGKTPKVDLLRVQGKNGNPSHTVVTFYTDENNDGKYTPGTDELLGSEMIKDGAKGADGRDGKSLLTVKDGKETKVYQEDPANPGQPLNPEKPLAVIRDGVDGKSPTVTAVRKDEAGHKGVEITVDNHDGSQPTTVFVQDGAKGKTGATGQDGQTPTITTQRGQDGQSTVVTITTSGKDPVTFTVKDGKNGKDGRAPKIKVEDITSPSRIRRDTDAAATPTRNGIRVTVYDDVNDNGVYDEGVDKVLNSKDIYNGIDGRDGSAPTITTKDNGDGTHTITVQNPDGSESTTVVKDGKDGKTANITTTENPDGSHTITVTNPDGSTKETVVKNGKDGKTPKVEVTDNNDGTHTVKVTDGDGNVTNAIIKDGKDGKAATATTTENPDGSHTVTITNPDGTKNEFVVKNGRDGVDGRTPTASVRDNGDGSHTIVITNPEGVTTETTVRDGKSPKVTITDEQNGTHKISVLNGDGTTTETIIKDGKSPVATVRDNQDGTYTIRVENGNGTVSETTVRDGKSPTAKVVDNGDGTHTITVVNSDGTTTTTTVRDGREPKLEVIDNNDGSHTIKVTGADGKETTTTIFDGKSPKANIVDNGDGTHTLTIVDSDGREYKSIIKDGKDGKDGVSPTVTVENNNDGTHVVTITNPDGSKTEMVIKDGKDGKSPKVSVEDNGDGSHTITIINSDGTVTKTVIKDGKDGRDGRDGRDGKDGKDGKCGCQDKPVTPSNDKPVPPTPNVPTPEVPVQPTPAVPTPNVPVPKQPVVPTPAQPATPVNANPVAPTTGKENRGDKLPETGSQSDYISVLLGSGILLSLYVGRRKED
ncbi:putative collagen-like surface-anchored protein [Streptococcus pneumoniae]|nr:putative collagen-like surface-anchored protein [Streptococcus pneumoniae]VNJ76120.1 putative collagen-like surface-anchored protein [Streptococcus pneumoniae]VNO06763.1 putative collagen-like surface-anchored protein [Streptococcus pneumoniae]VNR08468.1 putative collagen-like surface-anchored protein [Streptococcus pneumoniae]VRF73555.1 putative collagen-like surface-anchored protein [Streptococcus pneumoniae]